MSSYKVYISSTYKDLKSYRAKVRESLNKVSNFKVVGMEDYVAEDKQPLDECLEDVIACDIYLLILANRYGYVAPGDTFSITHREYRCAREHNKITLVFKAENIEDRFSVDTDDIGQPSPAKKQAMLNDLKAEVSQQRLSHPEGFTSEYHLALQVMESLIRSPKVDFDGELNQDRKIFCNRANQVYDFYHLVRQKQPFNVFLIQGNELDLGQSLVERLSKYYLVTSKPVLVSYHEFIRDPSYDNFRRRLLDELCSQLLYNDSISANSPADLLAALKNTGVSTLALVSSVSDAVQWQTGYQFLDNLLKEFAQASASVGGIRVFWFIVIDTPDALKQQLQSVSVKSAPPLTRLEKQDINTWINTYIDSNAGTVLSIRRLCFPITFNPAFNCDMYEAEELIRKFIKRFNERRKKNDEELLDILP